MAAYLIGHVKFRDTSWLKSEYVEVTARLEKELGGRHVASGLHEQVEGGDLGTVTSVVEFPTIGAARVFWNHPDYQRVVGIRRAGSDCHVVLIDAATVEGPFASSE
jgi:uncharacterized protein (DUF1330 family)